jgi:hypothetical protein
MQSVCIVLIRANSYLVLKRRISYDIKRRAVEATQHRVAVTHAYGHHRQPFGFERPDQLALPIMNEYCSWINRHHIEPCPWGTDVRQLGANAEVPELVVTRKPDLAMEFDL